jgi:hypothetical protein
MKYDQHPTMDFLPCDGLDWEPGVNEFDKDVSSSV